MTEPMSTCACGHHVTSHHLTPGKRRTWCRFQDARGRCGCKLFEAVPTK